VRAQAMAIGEKKGFQSGNGAIGHVIIVAALIIIVRHRHD